MDSCLSTKQQTVALYLTAEHACQYLAANQAKSMFVDSSITIDRYFYQHLLEVGFRRSGNFVYRPHCSNCKACVSVRVPVQHFIPRRSQRRCWERVSEDLQVSRRMPLFRPEHYALYQCYTAARHSDGNMVYATPQDYLDFLTTNWCPTMFVELRLHTKLIAVAVTDVLPNALSAVYTFFDPEQSHYSPGVLAILWQIHEAQRRNLPYVYLGYWISNCQKMCYKEQYRPLEAWNGQDWRRYEKTDEMLINTAFLY